MHAHEKFQCHLMRANKQNYFERDHVNKRTAKKWKSITGTSSNINILYRITYAHSHNNYPSTHYALKSQTTCILCWWCVCVPVLALKYIHTSIDWTVDWAGNLWFYASLAIRWQCKGEPTRNCCARDEGASKRTWLKLSKFSRHFDSWFETFQVFYVNTRGQQLCNKA